MGKFARNFTLDVFNQEVPGAASEKAGIDDVAMELQLRLGHGCFRGDHLRPLGHATAFCDVKVVLIKISLRQRGASAAI